MYCKAKGTSFHNTIHLLKGFCVFDHERNEKFLEELKVEPDDEKMRRHKSNWPLHTTRMNKTQQDAKNNVEL